MNTSERDKGFKAGCSLGGQFLVYVEKNGTVAMCKMYCTSC
jgi:hypothetical protein